MGKELLISEYCGWLAMNTVCTYWLTRILQLKSMKRFSDKQGVIIFAVGFTLLSEMNSIGHLVVDDTVYAWGHFLMFLCAFLYLYIFIDEAFLKILIGFLTMDICVMPEYAIKAGAEAVMDQMHLEINWLKIYPWNIVGNVMIQMKYPGVDGKAMVKERLAILENLMKEYDGELASGDEGVTIMMKSC